MSNKSNDIKIINQVDYIEFETTYKKYFQYSYDDTDRKPIYIPESSPSKECLFCGKKAPEVTFKKISHIIPEALGNKFLRFKNECDNCNEEYGSTLDQELVTDLFVVRAFSRRRGHKTEIKYKYGDATSFIESKSIDNTLEIFQDFDDDSIQRTIDEKNKTIEIKIKVPPVNYLSVAKELMRLTFMCLEYPDINDNKYLVDLMNGEKEYFPILFYGHIPGYGLKYTSFFVYYNAQQVIGGAKYICIFMFGTRFYILHIPYQTLSEPKEFFFPPPDFFGFNRTAYFVRSILCDSNIKVQREDQIFNCRFNKLEDQIENEVSEE